MTIPNYPGARANCPFNWLGRDCAVYHIILMEGVTPSWFAQQLDNFGLSCIGNWHFHKATDLQRFKNEYLVVDMLYNFEEVMNNMCRAINADGGNWREFFAVRRVQTDYKYYHEIDFCSVGIHRMPNDLRNLYCKPLMDDKSEQYFRNRENGCYTPEWVNEYINEQKSKHYGRSRKAS